MTIAMAGMLLLNMIQEPPERPPPEPIRLGYIPRDASGPIAPPLAVTPSSPIEVRLVDRRSGDEPLRIGTVGRRDGSSDELHAVNAVLPMVETALIRNTEVLAIPLRRGADLILSGRLLVFNLTVFEHGPRVRYTANVRIAFELLSREGPVLWTWMGQGDATLTSPGESSRRANEVLSVAMIEAYARMFADPELSRVWIGDEPSASKEEPRAARNPPVSPAELLEEIRGLQKSGADREAVAEHVRRRRLTAPLSVIDIADWTRAGIPRALLGIALSCEVPE